MIAGARAAGLFVLAAIWSAACPAQEPDVSAGLGRRSGVSSGSSDRERGQVATSSAGQVGQRRTREAGLEGIEPSARLNTRIQNRVETRIRNRIDRFYDPQANATSPFESAAQRTKTTAPRRR